MSMQADTRSSGSGLSEHDERAEAEFNEYTRLLVIANEDLTFETACAAAKQWGRFLAAYNDLPSAGRSVH